MNNPYQKYINQSLNTLTQAEMVIKLYEEIENQLTKARVYIIENNFVESNKALLKVQNILDHLVSTLDFKYDIAKNFSDLYNFFISQSILANIKKDVSYIDNIVPLISDLKDTFSEAEKISRIKNA